MTIKGHSHEWRTAARVCLIALVASAIPALCQTPAGKTGPDIRNAEGSAAEPFPDGSSGRRVEFRSSDGTFLPAYLRRPSGPGPFPVVVILHGGPDSRDVTYQIGRNTSAPAGNFVAAGWVVLAIDYRPPSVPPKSLERDDAAAAVQAVRSLPFVDGKRVALFGGSRGGGVMSSLASRVDVRCTVLCAPALIDLVALSKAVARGELVDGMIKKIIANAEKRYGATMAEIEKDPARYGYKSALTEAPTVRCPILIINGRNDKSSPLSAIQAYADKLRASGKEVATYFPENGLHGFYFGHPSATPETEQAARHAVDFIRKNFSR